MRARKRGGEQRNAQRVFRSFFQHPQRARIGGDEVAVVAAELREKCGAQLAERVIIGIRGSEAVGIKAALREAAKRRGYRT